MPTRTWCPALEAAPEALQNAVGLDASVSPTRPARPQSPKNKGAAAAQVSVASSQLGTNVREKVNKSQTFSSKIALSATKKSVPSKVSQDVTVAQPTTTESTALHFNSVKEFNDEATRAPEAGTERAFTNISFDNVDVSTAELGSNILSNSLFRCTTHGLSLRNSLKGTNSVLTLSRHMLEEGNDRLEELHLSGCAAGMGGATGEDPNTQAVEEFGKVLTETKMLRTLDLDGTGLQSAGQTLFPTFIQNRTVTSLDLSRNAMGRNEETITALAQLLQENKFIETTSLDDNELTSAHAKQLFDAIGSSNTRVATPEPPAEPEPEEYTDELPPEEDPPTVKVGFPEPEKKEEEEAEAGKEETPGEEAPAPEEAPPPKEKKDEGEGEEEQEEEEEEEAAATSKAEQDQPPPPSAEPPADEEDEEDEEKAEERRRLQEEKEEAERAELEAAKKEWEDRMEQYIWGPQKVLFEYDEGKARREIMQLHITETTAMKAEEKADRLESKKIQLDREKKDRERRSGWTHLKSLSIQNNPIGSEGVKALALMLRNQIPLSTEEQETLIQERQRQKEEEAARLKAEREAAREEERERKRQAAEERAAARAAAKESGEGGGDEEDEPAEEPEAEAEEPEDAKEEEDNEETPEEGLESLPEDKRKKPGVSSITSIDISSCGIGPSGLKYLSATLKDNCPTLKTLLMRKNKFAIKHTEVPVDGNEERPPEEEEEEPKRIRIEMEDWVSPGVVALAEALPYNGCLCTLDLSYNGMYPCNLRLLIQGLSENRSIQNLLLNGNHLGKDDKLLTELLTPYAAENSFLKTLSLASCELTDDSFTETTAKLLASIPNLQRLNLALNFWGGATVKKIGDAFSAITERMVELKYLSIGENKFNNGHDEQALGSAFNRFLRTLPLLQELDFHDSFIGDGAAPLIFEALDALNKLVVLNLAHTRLVDAPGLAMVLPNIRMLRNLDLGDNELSKEAAVSLTHAVGRCVTISKLALWSRSENLAEVILPSLVEAANVSPSLKEIDIGLSFQGVIPYYPTTTSPHSAAPNTSEETEPTTTENPEEQEHEQPKEEVEEDQFEPEPIEVLAGLLLKNRVTGACESSSGNW